MGFYEEIAKYYDYIFPFGKEAVNFIGKAAGDMPKEILDVACGTGNYSVELAKQGYAVTAVDIDEKMVEAIRSKATDKSYNIHAMKADMLELKSVLNSTYDLAFCIGNSLVHLDNLNEIKEFLKGIKCILKPGGGFAAQIINYDRVLEKEVKGLPTIENQEIGLSFERLYHYDEEKNKILFNTILKVDGKRIENTIPLYPLLSEDIAAVLKEVGFKEIKLFGDFSGNAFDKHNSYMLVLYAS